MMTKAYNHFTYDVARVPAHVLVLVTTTLSTLVERPGFLKQNCKKSSSKKLNATFWLKLTGFSKVLLRAKFN